MVGDLLIASVVPEVRSVVTVGVLESSEASLDGVTESTGVTTRAGVDIINTGKSKDLLKTGRSDNTSTTRSRNKTDTDRTALTSDLDGDSVDLTSVVTPVTTADRNDVHLSTEESTANGSGDFLVSLGTKTDMTVTVTNSDESLETKSLTGSGLLLDGEDLHDFFLETREELVDNFRLLDGEGEEGNFFNGVDLTSLDQTTEFGDGNPFVGFLVSRALASGTATTTAFFLRSLSGSRSRNYVLAFIEHMLTFSHCYFNWAILFVKIKEGWRVKVHMLVIGRIYFKLKHPRLQNV